MLDSLRSMLEVCINKKKIKNILYSDKPETRDCRSKQIEKKKEEIDFEHIVMLYVVFKHIKAIII